MPILVVGQPQPTAPPPRPSDTTQVLVSLTQGDDTVQLAGQWDILAGAEGLDDSAAELVTRAAPAVYGELPTGVVIPARDVFLPLQVYTAGGSHWKTARDALRLVTNPLRGPTLISVATNDGTVRQIDGWRVGDSPRWDVDTWSVHGWQRLGLLFKCPRPWWAGDIVRSGPWKVATTSGFLSSTFLAPVLGGSEIFGGGVQVSMPGDVPVWPTWTITGALTTATVVHEDTGRSWTLTATGLVRPITVVTDPLESRVLDGNGVRRWSALAAPYDLWPLPAGTSTVRVDITGANNTTSVIATSRALHLAAL